jgi:hypothetical protein
MYPIKVVEGKGGGGDKQMEGADSELEVIAGLYGAQEVIR